MISVTISEPLAQAAISQAKICHRTVDNQIDYWAKIGKIAEENPNLSFEFINAALQSQNEVLTESVDDIDSDALLIHEQLMNEFAPAFEKLALSSNQP